MLFFLSTPGWPPFVKLTIHFPFLHFSTSPPASILKYGVTWGLPLMAETARWGPKTHTPVLFCLIWGWLNHFLSYFPVNTCQFDKRKPPAKLPGNFPISGQCCRKLWGERMPLRPSTVILHRWQLSVGSRVSHRGAVFCRRVLTDVLRWFCERCFFSSGDQCLPCLWLIWCLSAGDQSHCRQREG